MFNGPCVCLVLCTSNYTFYVGSRYELFVSESWNHVNTCLFSSFDSCGDLYIVIAVLSHHFTHSDPYLQSHPHAFFLIPSFPPPQSHSCLHTVILTHTHTLIPTSSLSPPSLATSPYFVIECTPNDKVGASS